MFVTVELLKNLKACKSQRNQFAKLFPFGVELTRELIVQHAQEFNWHWCAENLASAAGYAVYLQADEQAWTAYQQAIEQAAAVYQQVVDEVTNAYQQAGVSAYAAFLQAGRLARAAYQRAERLARAVYNLACAAAFANAMGL